MIVRTFAAAALIAGLATAAQAGVCCQYGSPNGLSTNGLSSNGLSSNGLKLNGLASTARVEVIGVELPAKRSR